MTDTGTTSTLLSWIIFTPLLFALVGLIIPQSLQRMQRPLALLASLVGVGLAILLWHKFDGSLNTYQMLESYDWLPQWGVKYLLGIDGISLPLVMLTALITPVAILGTWPKADHPPKKEKFFVSMILLLQTGMYGTFLALDFFLFYFFWEVVLIPMFFMIGIWGGQDRLYATIKFFLYTMVGSVLMLVAIFWMIYQSQKNGMASASFLDLANLKFAFDASSPLKAIFSEQGLLFLAFALAFVIKVPMVPFHTWLPDAHVQAPTLGSVFLAAVLLKLGTYGLMRIGIPFFPEAASYFSYTMMVFGVIGIIYGALCAMAQNDFKKLVAYSSVSHMGYIVLGLFSFNQLAMAGSLYQMINHGISAAGLFLIVGFLYERLHTRQLNEFGSLAKTVPLMSVAFMIITLSSVALPGTNGFVGEFPILLGSFQVQPILTFLAGTGVILGAVYALKAYQRVMFGPSTKESNHTIKDLSIFEVLSMVILVVFILGIGFFPKVFFGKSDATLNQYHVVLTEKIGLERK